MKTKSKSNEHKNTSNKVNYNFQAYKDVKHTQETEENCGKAAEKKLFDRS
jgi:hypothetical protein